MSHSASKEAESTQLAADLNARSRAQAQEEATRQRMQELEGQLQTCGQPRSAPRRWGISNRNNSSANANNPGSSRDIR